MQRLGCGLLAGAMLLAPAFAQTAPSTPARPDSPRIALALSGGGARGIAHVGVLKVLEELRVPVHCVVGTSMGAIVGGTFAAGRSSQEMEAIVLAADWTEIFRDTPPRRERAVRRKIDDFKPLFGFEVGLRDGSVALPKGVIAGVSIESFFREMVQPAAEISDFDKLPVPYRAIATDLETGAAVVLGSGSVAQAMRASMSVPGGMAPVEIDGRLLVDGGLADNLPIDQARRLCGDVVIAVNISTPPLRRDQITSAGSVTAQMINFIGLQTVKDQLKSLTPKDVLVAPDLGDISSSSFDRSRDAIRIGEEATRAMAPQLQRYSLPADQYAAQRTRQLAAAPPYFKVDEIRVEGLERTNPKVVERLVESAPGQPLTEAKVATDLRRIFGTGDYEAISYRITGGAEGPRAMLIEPVEKSWGPDYLRFGLALASDFAGDNQFNVRAQYRRTWLNSLGAEWVSEAQVGQHAFFNTEWYQPLNLAGQWFVAPSLLRRRADARRVHRPGQSGGLQEHGDPGWDRRWRATRRLGRTARGLREVERARAGRHRFDAAAVVAGDVCGPARGAVHRPDRPGMVSSRRLRGGRHGVPRHDRARLGPHLQPCGARRARGEELGCAHLQRGGQRRNRIRIGHAGVRVVRAWRAAADVGISAGRVGRQQVRLRPTAVLQPDGQAA